MKRISIIIPAHNAAAYLAHAIASAQAQTYGNIEIVVVNDGSTDATQVILDTLGDRITVVHQAKLGPSAARNAGVNASNGEYLYFLDADDWLKPDAVSAQVRHLEAHPEFDLVAGGLENIDEYGCVISIQRPWIHHPDITLEWLTFGGLSGPTGVLLRRACFSAVGGFDTDLTFAEDIDFWWRLMQSGCRMSWLQRTVGSYRIHGNSLSQDFIVHHTQRVTLLDRHLSSSTLSPAMVAQRPVVVSLWKLELAGRLYSHGNSASGAEAILEAIDLNPALRDPDVMAEALANWKRDPRIGRRDEIVTQALVALPPSLDWMKSLKHRIELFHYRYNFYTAVLQRDRRGVMAAWLKLACNDIRWLINRGGWSSLVRSAGFRPTDD